MYQSAWQLETLKDRIRKVCFLTRHAILSSLVACNWPKTYQRAWPDQAATKDPRKWAPAESRGESEAHPVAAEIPAGLPPRLHSQPTSHYSILDCNRHFPNCFVLICLHSDHTNTAGWKKSENNSQMINVNTRHFVVYKFHYMPIYIAIWEHLFLWYSKNWFITIVVEAFSWFHVIVRSRRGSNHRMEKSI